MRAAPLVRAALVAVLQPTFDMVQVGYSRRVVFTKDERVAFSDTQGVYEPPSLGPDRQMQDDFEITGWISVTRNGSPDDQQATTERAFEILDSIDITLRSQPGMNLGLGASGVLWAFVAGAWSLTEAPASETGGACNASIEFRVRCRARTRLAV